jgi:hypothetical protein
MPVNGTCEWRISVERMSVESMSVERICSWNEAELSPYLAVRSGVRGKIARLHRRQACSVAGFWVRLSVYALEFTH